MPVIRNKLNQRITIDLDSGKNIDLFAKGTADVSEDDLSSVHLQAFIAKGDVVVQKKEKPEKRESKASSAYPKKGRS